nr:hypothetical protein CFP56_63880 [Quercus suber]
MTAEIRKDIGGKIGRVLEVDKRAMQADQEKFLRIRVDLPIISHNNLLLLCRWRKGLMSKNISFSHSPFWVQIWGLLFENMTAKIRKDIEQSLERQYGGWLKAGGATKGGGEKVKTKSHAVAEKGSSPSQTKGGIDSDRGSGLTMVGKAVLDMVKGTSMSNPWVQDKLNRWDNMAKVGLEMRLNQGARDRLEGSKTKLVSKLFQRNESAQPEVNKAYRLYIEDLENSSPIKPKEKKNTSEEVKEQELGLDQTKKLGAKGILKKKNSKGEEQGPRS